MNISRINKIIFENKGILVILTLAFIFRLTFEFHHYELWWDEATYIAIGKNIYSHGQLGLWEPLRPLLLPMLLGLFWKIGLPLILAGRLIVLLSSLAIIYLVYLLGKRIFNKKVGIIASLFVSFSPLFFVYNFLILTEILSVVFVLWAVYLFTLGKRFSTGILIGLSLLTKFTGGLFLLPLLLSIVINNYYTEKKRFIILSLKESTVLLFGFFVAISPYLVVNQILYDSSIFPLIESRTSIVRDVYCNITYFNPWYYYLKTIFLDNPLSLFCIFGIFLGLQKDKTPNKFLILLLLFAGLVWFSQLHCRHDRYVLYMIPFTSMLAAYGINWFFRKHSNYIVLFIILFILLSIPFVINKHKTFYPTLSRDISEYYYKFLENKNITGEIWVSNPWPALYTSKKVNLIYYPIYNYEIAYTFNDYVVRNSSKISYIFFDNTGGVICNPSDNKCIKENTKILNYLKDNYQTVFYRKYDKYEYFIFKGG